MKTEQNPAPSQTATRLQSSGLSMAIFPVMCRAFLFWLCIFAAGCVSDAGRQAALQVTTTSNAANNWLRVQVDPSLVPDVVWQKLVDSVTGCYPSLEMVDATSGYMRSVYNIKKFGNPNPRAGGQFIVRTRFICSISSKSPLVYKMKIESEWSAPVIVGGGLFAPEQVVQQDWTPYDRVFKDDAQLVEELQSRLGVK
jgi:hypothetical protein